MDQLQTSIGPGLTFSDQPDPPRPHQQFRLANFANYTAEKLRGFENCAFSQLDQNELVECITTWYESCAQAMLKGNYSLIDQWVGKQRNVAAEHGLKLEDFLELLRICRRSAIEVERWDPELLSPIDDVITESLQRGTENSDWKMPANVDYLGRKPAGSPSIENIAAVTGDTSVEVANERRAANREHVKVPMRISGYGITGYHLDFVVQTESVSPSGLYFVAKEPFSKGLPVHVICPYSKDPGANNKNFSAKVVRVDRRTDKSRGIAVQFSGPGNADGEPTSNR